MSSVEYIDDPALSARMAERRRELLDKSVQEMTVAERLTLRAMERRETLLVESEAGEFEVVVRLPLAAEVREIETLRTDAVRAATEIRHLTLRLIHLQGRNKEESAEKLIEVQQALEILQEQSAGANHHILEFVADLCIDPSITVEFLESGLFAPDDIGGIVSGVLKASQERAAEARSFRKK